MLILPENKDQVIAKLVALAETHEKAAIYYHGSAHTRAILEMPIVTPNFFNGVTDLPNVNEFKGVLDQIVGVIEKCESTSGRFKLSENHLLPILKEVNKVCPIDKLVYLEYKGQPVIVRFVCNKHHMFTLSSEGCQDGDYHIFDMDDGYVPSYFSSPWLAMVDAFNVWKQGGRKGPVLTSNCLKHISSQEEKDEDEGTISNVNTLHTPTEKDEDEDKCSTSETSNVNTQHVPLPASTE